MVYIDLKMHHVHRGNEYSPDEPQSIVPEDCGGTVVEHTRVFAVPLTASMNSAVLEQFDRDH